MMLKEKLPNNTRKPQPKKILTLHHRLQVQGRMGAQQDQKAQ